MTDPYYNNVSLLLSFDQDGPGQGYFLDYSSYKNAIFNNGNCRISNAQSKYGETSAYFDGNSGSYLSCPVNSAFAMGNGNFTIEFLTYLTVLPTAYKRIFSYCKPSITGVADEGLILEIDNTNKMTATFSNGSTYLGITDPSVMVINTWTHWAFVRNGTVAALYREGISVGTVSCGTNTVADSTTHVFIIGAWAQGMIRLYQGYLDELRVTKGIARYTSNFTPPTALKADAPAPLTFKPQVTNIIPKKLLLEWATLTPNRKVTNVIPRVLRPEKDATYGGSGTISGHVKIGNIPAKRKVRLYASKTGMLIREQWSNDDGSYSFVGLKKELYYTITAVDYNGTYNDVIDANVLSL